MDKTANTLANERCSDCGALLAMVGRSHRCGGGFAPSVTETLAAVRTDDGPAVVGGIGQATTIVETRDAGTTYKHHDPEKRRAYMREYMRKYR